MQDFKCNKTEDSERSKIKDSKNYIGTGIFHWFGYILPFEERIKLIKEAGYDYVMLWWEDESYPDFLDRKNFNSIVKSYGIKIDNIHLPCDNINLLWSESLGKRQNQTDIIMNWLDECKKFGSDTVVLHTTQGNGIKLNYEVGYKSFNRIVKEAENIKIKIALENTQMFHYTDFILKEFNSDCTGFCYDSSHDFIDGQSCGGILEKWKHKLFAVHLSDNDGTMDRHWIPGKGHVNWHKTINFIKQTDCKSFSMEAYPYKEEKELSPIQFLIKARNNLISKI